MTTSSRSPSATTAAASTSTITPALRKATLASPASANAPTDDVLNTIRKVMSGETAITSELKEQCEADLPALTQKQSDILESVARGYANKDIAKQFGITEVGVKKHLRLIFAKLGAANRSEAVAIALKKQLLKV